MSLGLDRRTASWGLTNSFAIKQYRLPTLPLAHHLSGLDVALVCLFLIGLYTNYTIPISAKVPFPSAPAGVAGLLLLWRRRHDVTTRSFTCFMAVIFLYIASILCATNIEFLSRRFNGLVQLTYSLTIGYGLFLTVVRANRRQAAALFLAVSLVILIGCLLETYGGLRPLSDAVRNAIYKRGVYENDLRDMVFYNRIRPKFFASEPSSVTFVYTLCTFLWLVISPWRHKLVVYLALAGLGLFAMPGPTLLLMLLLIMPYMLFLASRVAGRLSGVRVVKVLLAGAVFLTVFVAAANVLFAERLRETTNGNDPSFFYRVQGPALVAAYIGQNYPLAGTGLTGEPFIEREVINVYVRSSSFSTGWQILSPATELLINYFWLHWIYLGVLWGTVLVVALTLWLNVLGVPSPAFAWMVWAILGQSSGAYVGPTCWAVFFLAAAAAVLQQRPRELDEAPLVEPAPPPDIRAAWLETISTRAAARATTPARPLTLVQGVDDRPRIERLGPFPPQGRDAAD
jgi:hypothetical protein